MIEEELVACFGTGFERGRESASYDKQNALLWTCIEEGGCSYLESIKIDCSH